VLDVRCPADRPRPHGDVLGLEVRDHARTGVRPHRSLCVRPDGCADDDPEPTGSRHEHGEGNGPEPKAHAPPDRGTRPNGLREERPARCLLRGLPDRARGRYERGRELAALRAPRQMRPQEETLELGELAVEAKRRPFAGAGTPAFMTAWTRKHLAPSDDSPKLMLEKLARRAAPANVAASTRARSARGLVATVPRAFAAPLEPDSPPPGRRGLALRPRVRCRSAGRACPQDTERAPRRSVTPSPSRRSARSRRPPEADTSTRRGASARAR
jgi:hypothetical protein